MKKHTLYSSILLASATMGAAVAVPAVAQERPSFQLEEIVVTARRREESLQEVPVSMTVLTQEQMHNANITNASDIATYTPSLHANQRFGSDSTNFAIRGFSQELRTTSSVGVYFAEVVAPRGANTTQSGDGAGPGDFFDLESVQVLKGPQGTLFGRNTTGGAVLLTPKKPTQELEGYAEVSMGNYDMGRAQGVINIPVSDSFRVRLGVDHQERDGYLKNISETGPSHFADIGYTSFRASAVWDVTDTLENYTIVKYTDSANNGAPYSVFACNNEVDPVTGRAPSLGAFCEADLASREAAGNNGFYDVYNFHPRSKSELEQIQVINTTTWEVNDNITVKNIVSYAEFESRQNFALYGTNWQLPIFGMVGGNFMPVGTQGVQFQVVGAPDYPTTDQKTFVEEFQVQGLALNDRLTWQAGLYYEKSKPNGTYGSFNPAQISCDMSTVVLPDPADWRCNDLMAALARLQNPEAGPVGTAFHAPGGVTYENKAVYFQGTYEFTEQWSMTAGVRYTDDKTKGWTDETVYYFPGVVTGGYYAPIASYTQSRRPKTHSEEPTWLIGVEYKPTSELMLYGKYARGYRQGSVNLASVQAWETHGPEKVDTYEIGAKTSFGGPFPGTFNVAAFYNDFEDQQVQFGYLRDNGVGSTSILNAGASTLWGIEADANILLSDNLTLTASYAYLDTEVDELVLPSEPWPEGVAIFSGTSTAEGEPLSYTPKNKLVASLSYLLPVDPALGDIIASVTYVYTDKMQAVSKHTSALATLPSYELVNLNLNWQGVAGSPVDVALFATNLLDEKYRTYLTGNWLTGMEAGRTGEPRMYGVRVRYNF